jgi:hypothetical protein
MNTDTQHRLELLPRFLEKTLQGENCWLWQGSIDTQGYGQLTVAQKPLQAHRLAYTLFKGDIPAGSVIRHSCHNRQCVNPQHLCQGTQKDNIQDSVKAGRMASGERNGRAKLTLENVEEIKQLRQQGWSQQKIGQKFNLHHTTVGSLLRGKTWKPLHTKET